MSATPTQLTLRELRRTWPLVSVVEHWNPHARIRQDLFGFVDVLAVGPGGTLAVQTTTDHNVLDRVRKIRASDALEHVLAAGWWVEAHGWAKVRNRWRLVRRFNVTGHGAYEVEVVA